MYLWLVTCFLYLFQFCGSFWPRSSLDCYKRPPAAQTIETLSINPERNIECTKDVFTRRIKVSLLFRKARLTVRESESDMYAVYASPNPLGQFFFTIMQFSGKKFQIVRWRHPQLLVPPGKYWIRHRYSFLMRADVLAFLFLFKVEKCIEEGEFLHNQL